MEPYKPLSEDIETQYPNKDSNTCLKITTYTVAVLNLITTLGALGLCVATGGLSSILFAFYGNSKQDGILELVIISSTFLVVLSIGWMVMLGCFISSLVKKKAIRCSEVCCNYMLHTVAIWIVILRAVLMSIISSLGTLFDDYQNILFLMFIDIAMNVVFLVVYNFYAVKKNFGNPKKHKSVGLDFDG